MWKGGHGSASSRFGVRSRRRRPVRSRVVLGLGRGDGGLGPGGVLQAAASAGDGDDQRVVQEAVEDGPGGGHVLEELAPVLEGRLLVMMVERVS